MLQGQGSDVKIPVACTRTHYRDPVPVTYSTVVPWYTAPIC